MRVVTVGEQMRELDRVRFAAQWFDQHPEHWSVSLTEEGELCDIGPDTWLALRWGTGQAVLILRVNYETPVVYADCIPTPPYPRVKEAVPGATRVEYDGVPTGNPPGIPATNNGLPGTRGVPAPAYSPPPPSRTVGDPELGPRT